MKTKEEEMKENGEVSEIIRNSLITLAGLYITYVLYSVFGVFYALGMGIALTAAGLWLSHFYCKGSVAKISFKSWLKQAILNLAKN